jgi:hypothetical protein
LKFQVVDSPLLLSGLFAADIHVSGVGSRRVEKPARLRRPLLSDGRIRRRPA